MQIAEVRGEPLTYAQLDEINKAYSKTMVDVNSYLISQREKNQEKGQAAPQNTFLSKQSSKGYEFDMMNFVVQNNLVNYGLSAPSLVTPFAINKMNLLLMI